jgi:hypothetical protein
MENKIKNLKMIAFIESLKNIHKLEQKFENAYSLDNSNNIIYDYNFKLDIMDKLERQINKEFGNIHYEIKNKILRLISEYYIVNNHIKNYRGIIRHTIHELDNLNEYEFKYKTLLHFYKDLLKYTILSESTLEFYFS